MWLAIFCRCRCDDSGCIKCDSGETALYLHGLIDREYSHICFTVPTGYNATHIKKKNKEVRYANPEILDMGICEIPSSSGNLVNGMIHTAKQLKDKVKNMSGGNSEVA